MLIVLVPGERLTLTRTSTPNGAYGSFLESHSRYPRNWCFGYAESSARISSSFRSPTASVINEIFSPEWQWLSEFLEQSKASGINLILRHFIFVIMWYYILRFDDLIYNYSSVCNCSSQNTASLSRATQTVGASKDRWPVESEDSTATGTRWAGETKHTWRRWPRGSKPRREASHAEESEISRSAERSTESSTRTPRAHTEEYFTHGGTYRESGQRWAISSNLSHSFKVI